MYLLFWFFKNFIKNPRIRSIVRGFPFVNRFKRFDLNSFRKTSRDFMFRLFSPLLHTTSRPHILNSLPHSMTNDDDIHDRFTNMYSSTHQVIEDDLQFVFQALAVFLLHSRSNVRIPRSLRHEQGSSKNFIIHPSLFTHLTLWKQTRPKFHLFQIWLSAKSATKKMNIFRDFFVKLS